MEAVFPGPAVVDLYSVFCRRLAPVARELDDEALFGVGQAFVTHFEHRDDCVLVGNFVHVVVGDDDLGLEVA